jgi:cytochrome b6-f complex iron-sulfur subunit
MATPLPTRRTVLACASACAAATLAGCGGDEPSAGAQESAGEAGTPLVPLSEVPVGSAVSVEGPDGPLLVAQPSEGEAVAFSAICTHQGCTVVPDGEQLRCPCHASVYEAATGDNVSGPAPRPLDEVPVQVSDGQVVLA